MENPNRDLKLSWLDKDIQRFKDLGCLIPRTQYNLYEKIRDFWTNGRNIIDVGCSIGVGTNILSHNANFVWGIDLNEEAVKFAKSTFKRPNMDFELLDIENPTTRDYAKFDVVVMSEVIEHLNNPEEGISYIKRFFSDGTVGFITAPNINHETVKEIDKCNDLHVNHWTPGEFYGFLIKHFRSVTLFNDEKINQWNQEETMDGNGICRLTVAKVEGAY